MRRGRIFMIIGMLVIVAMAVALPMGCSSTQCANGQRALASAQAGYDRAVASGNAQQAQRYWWAVEAVRAATDMWCAGQGEEPQVVE